MKKSAVIEVIVSLLVFLFIYAAISKLLDLSKFRYQLGQSPFMTRLAPIAVWAIPTSEILIAIALMIKRYRTAGLYLAFYLMLVFSGYIYIMLRYSPHLPCTCGGVLSSMSWKQHLVFNLFFSGLVLLSAILHQYPPLHPHPTGKKLNT